jgi:hypothetical protein
LSRASRREASSSTLLDLGGDIAGNGLSKLFLTIAAAFAEAERERIRQVKAGKVRAVASSEAAAFFYCPRS